jgi:hypothetical protein
MYVHHHGAQGFHLGDELLGLHNHQMHVEGFLAQLGHVFEHGEAKRDVGHEHAIHNVEVKPVSLALVNLCQVGLQVAKVGGQQ